MLVSEIHFLVSAQHHVEPLEAPDPYEPVEVPDHLRYAVYRRDPAALQTLRNMEAAKRAAYNAEVRAYQAQFSGGRGATPISYRRIERPSAYEPAEVPDHLRVAAYYNDPRALQEIRRLEAANRAAYNAKVAAYRAQFRQPARPAHAPRAHHTSSTHQVHG